MDCSTLGLPVHHQLLEFTQIHVHWVGDAIQPSHPLSFSPPPVFNLSQHQGIFKWVSSSHQVAKVLEFQLQHQSFQWTPGLISFTMDWLDFLAAQGTLKSLLLEYRLLVIYNLHVNHKYHGLPDLLAPSPQLGKLPGLCPLLSFTSLTLQGKRVALWLLFSRARIQDDDRDLVYFPCLRDHCPALLDAQNLQAVVSWTFFCFSVFQSGW